MQGDNKQPEKNETAEQRAERMNAQEGSYAHVKADDLTPEQSQQVAKLLQGTRSQGG